MRRLQLRRRLETQAALRSLSVFACFVVATTVGVAQQPPPGQGAPPAGTGMIAGRAFDSDSGEGIPGALIVLGPAGPARPGAPSRPFPGVLTDSQGRFVFTSLPEGSYLATSSRDGYSQQTLARTVELSAGSRITDFNFRLTKFNSLVGTVRDDSGDPVVGIDVIAFARSVTSGRPAVFAPRGRSRTDDRGQYRINQLPAGQYYVCACTREVIPFDGQLLTTLAARPLDLLSVARRAVISGADVASLDKTLRTYAPTFYPNTPLASRAERVALEKGETKTDVDITAVTVRAVRVSGQIIGAPPSTVSASSMRLIPAGDIPEAVVITQLPPVLVQPDGRFDFAGVPPGTYTLDVLTSPGAAPGGPSGLAMTFVGARGLPAPPAPPPPPAPGRGGAPAPPAEMLWVSETIVVGDDDVTGLVVGVQPGVRIRGKIEFVGAGAPPPNTGRFIQLVPIEVRPGPAAAFAAQLNPDFTFEFVIPPGRYAMPLPTFSPGWTNLKAITARGADMIDAPLVVDRDIPDLVVTLTDAPPAQILGTVDLPSTEVPEEWTVLVFPSDRRFWKEPFGAVRRFIWPRVNGQRAFTARVPPGDYYLSLVRGTPTDWMEAAVLEELAKNAATVTLIEGDKKQVQVKR